MERSCSFSLYHFHQSVHRFLPFRTSQVCNTKLSNRTPQGKQFDFWKPFSPYLMKCFNSLVSGYQQSSNKLNKCAVDISMLV